VTQLTLCSPRQSDFLTGGSWTDFGGLETTVETVDSGVWTSVVSGAFCFRSLFLLLMKLSLFSFERTLSRTLSSSFRCTEPSRTILSEITDKRITTALFVC